MAVVDPAGRLVAEAGDPRLVTFWRSAAKAFQAMPLVEDGAADRFEFGSEELALACASHSSEPMHLAVADRMLARLGLGEEALACGPHVPLGPAVAQYVAREGIPLTPRWSNCSGKHAAMLATCLHRGWPPAGYERPDHPLQRRILETVTRWTDTAITQLDLATDGCNTVCYGLPLIGMATAWARFGVATDPAARRLREAMMAHPELVAGTGRSCTDLMRAWPGELVVKIGADGIYCAAIPSLGLGVALKVKSGDMRAAPVALIAVLRQLLEHAGASDVPTALREGLTAHARPAIRNTRAVVTGEIRAAGGLRFRGHLP